MQRFLNPLSMKVMKSKLSKFSNYRLLSSLNSSYTPKHIGGNKVSVVGVGQVGMACAMSIAQSAPVHEIALYDVGAAKVTGEVLDMVHAVPFLKNHAPLVYGSDDVSVTADSDLVVVSCGVRQSPGESRLSLVDRNIAIFEKLIPELVAASPDAVLLIVSNPVDIMTLVAYNLSGLPRSRVVGSGTTLDSGRFRSYLAEIFGVGVESVGGYVVGEHGDSSVALFSSVTIGGIPYYRLTGPNSNLHALDSVQQKVRDSAKTVIGSKGYTNWGVGWCVGKISGAILANSNTVFPVSVSAKGLLPGCPEQHGSKVHGEPDDIYLSLPTIVNASGASKVLVPTPGGGGPTELSEAAALKESAETLLSVIRGVSIPARRGPVEILQTYTAL